MLCAEPKKHKHFRPGTRPGGFGYPAGRIGDQGDREIVYVPNVCVPFPAPIFVEISCEVSPGKQGVSETLPYCFATVVVFCYHRSELI